MTPRPPRTGARAGTESLACGLLARTSAPHPPGVVLVAGDDGLAEALSDAGVHAIATRDAAAGVQVLRDAGATAVYLLGFGEAGTEALAAADRLAVAGTIAFWAAPPADAVRTPVLALYGGADEQVTEAEIERFHASLSAAGTLQELVVYDGAPRGFFTGALPGQEALCDDAWRRVLRFVGVPVLTS